MSEFSPFKEPLVRVAPSELKEFYSIAEGWHVEYKSQPTPPKELAKSLSSFANQYGGWLVLGVVEDAKTLTAQEFRGLSQEQVSRVVQHLRDASRDCVNPEVYYEHRIFDGPIGEINLPSGKSVVVVNVPQAPEPPYVHADARIYRRVGDSASPKPETDPSILDRLSLRAQQSRERLTRMVSRIPVTSKAEEDNCYLHVTLMSDPYEIEGHWYGGTFEDFSEIMRKDPIPFDNIYTNAAGFVARQAKNNDPYRRTLTWEFDRHGHSFISLPINTLNTQDEKLARYNIGPLFGKLIGSHPLLSSRLLDLNEVFKASWAIAVRHRELAAKADNYGPFYFKGHIENVWRRVPFLDMTSLLDHVQKFGVPVIQDDNVLVPPGTDLNSFALLSANQDYRGETAADVSLRTRDAVRMSTPIFNALGIPLEILRDAAEELVIASGMTLSGPRHAEPLPLGQRPSSPA